MQECSATFPERPKDSAATSFQGSLISGILFVLRHATVRWVQISFQKGVVFVRNQLANRFQVC